MSDTLTIDPIIAEPLQDEMTFTAKAISEIKRLKESNNIPAEFGLRVGVKTRGCSGLSYFVEYADQKKKFEDVVEDKGVTIFVEPKSILFLIGSEIDYEVSKLSARFVFRNPNETDACGCGESVTITPVDPGTLAN